MQTKKRRRGPETSILSDAKRPVLKKCRTSIGSCREVGLLFGVTESSVRKTEDGNSTPNLLNAFMYSILLKKPLEELFPDLFAEAEKRMEQSTKITE